MEFVILNYEHGEDMELSGRVALVTGGAGGIGGAVVRKLAQASQGKGVTVVDAPVSGGEAGARERHLCYMVGGEKDIFEKCHPILAASAAHIFHLGELGSGATAKMIVQVVVCINMLGTYEAELLSENAVSISKPYKQSCA